jgi:hypothetical protein
MFFDRSLLTPAVYARGLPIEACMRRAARELRSAYATSVGEADLRLAYTPVNT